MNTNIRVNVETPKPTDAEKIEKLGCDLWWREHSIGVLTKKLEWADFVNQMAQDNAVRMMKVLCERAKQVRTLQRVVVPVAYLLGGFTGACVMHVLAQFIK